MWYRLWWFLSLTIAFNLNTTAQEKSTDRIRRRLSTCSTDTTRVKLMVEMSFYQTQPDSGKRWAHQALQLSQRIGYKKGEASALVQLSNHHWATSDFIMALHYASRSIRIREEMKDEAGLSYSYNMIALVYRELGDGKNAILYLNKTAQLLPAIEDSCHFYKRAVVYGSLGRSWMLLDQTDSAFYYYQKSYQLFNASRNEYQMYLATSGLGDVELKKQNTGIALAFYREALQNCASFNDTTAYTETYFKMAQYFHKTGRPDSAEHYAGLGLICAKRMNNYKVIQDAAYLLYDVTPVDRQAEKLSALEAAWQAMAVQHEIDKAGQIQSLLLEEETHRTEKEALKKQSDSERKKLIEYSLIAVFVFGFLILLQFLSRSILINEKWVAFLGTLSLLLVFEFIYLLLHPFLESVTRHSPALILLCLVGLGALLIPLHHKIETWLVSALKKRNRNYRFNSAKKIIAHIKETEKKEAENKDES